MKELICPNCGHVFAADESGYNELLAQVRTREFEASVKTAVAAALAESQRKADKAMADLREEKNREIARRDAALAAAKAEKDNAVRAAVAEAVTEASNTITSLKADAKTFESEKTLAVERALQKQKDEMKEEFDRSIRTLNTEHSKELAAMKAEVDEARSIKARLSTKMVGETLEQHCESEFNRIRSMAFPRAEFHKDNDTSINGQKGDYIFRDFAEDGTEIVSIMFEMKNQSDDSANTKKNADFFKKLDSDRRAKKCEYAVLVSLLEPDSELYNQGIVDVGYEYPKMLVIRPQFFLPIIGLLRNAALNAVDYKRQLAEAKQQTIDVTTFENDVEEFKRLFLKHTKWAADKHQAAIGNINKVIKILEEVKSALEGSDKDLVHAERKLDDLTVKKLTAKNPTMAAKFEEARARQAEADGGAIPVIAEILED